MSKDAIEETHESYGMASFNRFTGGPLNFFGSATRHHAGVALEIHSGAVKRDLGQAWYHEHKPLLRIEMSENQFAQLITSMNRESVPVTLTRIFRGNIAEFKKTASQRARKSASKHKSVTTSKRS